MASLQTNVNRLAVALYAAGLTLLPLLIDQHVISATVGTDIGAGVTAFAVAWHGGQALSARSANTGTLPAAPLAAALSVAPAATMPPAPAVQTVDPVPAGVSSLPLIDTSTYPATRAAPAETTATAASTVAPAPNTPPAAP